MSVANSLKGDGNITDPSSQKRTVDDFARLDSYTLLVILFSEFILLSGTGNYSYMIFAGAAPTKVRCSNINLTLVDSCSMPETYRKGSNCSLEMDYEFKSVNVEFQHVCEETALVKQSISIQMVGVLGGTLISGFLSDRCGRLKVLMLSYIVTFVLGIACSFSNSLLAFTVIRTMQGPFVGGLVGTASVYMTEHIPKQHRFWVSTIIGWSFNFILVVLVAIYSKEWRSLQLNIVLASSPAFILFWFVRESPRWLVQHGQLDRARKVLKRGKKGCLHEESIEELLKDEYQATQLRKKKQKVYTWKHLFYTKELGTAVFILSIGTFITSMTNYALVFNLEKLSGSIFWNSLNMALIRWIINLVTGILDFKVSSVGRKLVHFLSHGFVGICIGVITVIYLIGIENEYRFVTRIATISALSMSTQIYVTKNVVTMELFPTVVRNQAISFKSMFSRFGVIIAPQLFLVSPWPVVPYSLLAILAVADTTLFQIFIPETKGIPLPEKLPEKRKNNSQLLES